MPDGIKLQTPDAPQRLEKVPVPEQPKEGASEKRAKESIPQRSQAGEKEQQSPSIPVQAQAPVASTVSKTQLQKDIEDILAEDLKEFYLSLSVQQRVQFKREGEKAAARIEILLKNVKVKISEILHIIRAWLSVLPGMNTFFLEKEVKIKTEQILELKEELEREE